MEGENWAPEIFIEALLFYKQELLSLEQTQSSISAINPQYIVDIFNYVKSSESKSTIRKYKQ